MLLFYFNDKFKRYLE